MGSRRRTQAISLFSFQDIITGVTAIILLLTLLLVLELVARKAGASDSRSSAVADQLVDLVKEVEASRTNLEGIEVAIASSSADEVLAVIENEKSQVAESIAEYESKLAAALKDKINSKMVLLERRAELREEHLERKNVLAQSLENQEMQAENDAMLQSVDGLKEQIVANGRRAELPAGPPILRFREKDGGESRSLLVVLGRQKITVIVLRSGEEVVWTGGAAVNQFRAWMSAKGRALNHCVIVLRPSGFQYFSAITEFLEENKYAVGKELIGEAQKLQISMRGGGG